MKLKGSVNLLFLLVLSAFIVGCNQNAISQTPDSIEQELWEDSFEIIDLIEKLAKNKKEASQEQENLMRVYVDNYYVNRDFFQNELSQFYTVSEQLLISKVILARGTLINDQVRMEFDLESGEGFQDTLSKVQDFRVFTKTLD